MERLILLLYGDSMPPYQHLNRIVDKYIHYFLKASEEEAFIETDYVEVIIEEEYLGQQNRQWHYPLVAPVKREFLAKFIRIFQDFHCRVATCSEDHEHPTWRMGEVEYEGYCYYMKDDKQKIMFLWDYSKNGERDSVFTLDGFRQLPMERKYKVFSEKEDTEVVFKRWLEEIQWE